MIEYICFTLVIAILVLAYLFHKQKENEPNHYKYFPWTKIQ